MPIAEEFQFQLATKEKLFARVAMCGPTGSGKTIDSLIIANRLAPDGLIAVADTEHDSARKYANDLSFPYQVFNFEAPFDPYRLSRLIAAAEKQGVKVLIIDSLSHFWNAEGGTQSIVDAAASRFGGNSFAGWKVGTPAQETMVRAILQCQMHLIVTMRAKMVYEQDRDEKGKLIVRKLGLAPVQRQDTEYEFDLVVDVDTEHRISVSKTRCLKLGDFFGSKEKVPELADTFVAWLNDGVPADRPAAPAAVVPIAPAANGTTTSTAASGTRQAPERRPLGEACPLCGREGAAFHHPTKPDRYFCTSSVRTTDGGKGCDKTFGDEELATARTARAGNAAESMAAEPKPEGDQQEGPAIPETAATTAETPAEKGPETPEATVPAAEPAPAPPAATEPAPEPEKPQPAQDNVVPLPAITKEERTELIKLLNQLDTAQKFTAAEWDKLLKEGAARARAQLVTLLALPGELRPSRREMRVFCALPYDEQMAVLADLATKATRLSA